MYIIRGREEIGESDPGRARRGGGESATLKSGYERVAKKDEEVENFITTTGLRRWLAKIVFRERIQIIWESEEDSLQLA